MMFHIKSRSARKLFYEFTELKKRYWRRYFQTHDYFYVTVENMNEKTIKE
ncbi:MAG: transposase [Candidatus Competibacteraceae bacterium]|nr:transposase [Candidatus Competibacteraceae bacterium]